MACKIIFKSIFFAFVFAAGVSAGAQVAINLFPSPANQFFIDNLWNTTIINPSASAINAQVQFAIRDNTSSPILTINIPLENLTPGVNHITSMEAQSGKWAYGNSSASLMLQQTGKLPFGAYTFCVTVVSASNKPLGSYCEEREVKPISSPLLSSPYNEEEIAITNPMLVWIPPQPLLGITISYALRLVEVQQGQSPEQAMLQGPALLNLNGLTNINLNYPADAPCLQQGREYAWQVGASYEGYNLGTTDIWTFKIKKPVIKETDDAIYPVASKKSDAKFYVSHGIFHFAYNNKNGEKNLTYTIQSIGENKERLKSLPDIMLKPGMNKIDIDVKHNPGLKSECYYDLMVKDSKGQIFKILYYYIEQ
jgi:hypothetical protein